MKRIVTLLTVFALLLTGCSLFKTSVPEPIQYPNYTFSQAPSVDQLRSTAVKAVYDMLTVQWTPGESISYYNTAGRDKQFDYTPGNVYGGLLYSGASTGLFQFLEYYDFETGRLEYTGNTEDLKDSLGSGCADTLIWGLNTVCTTLKGGYYPSMMVYQNGYYPVGDYSYNPSVSSYYLLSTKDIIAQNGQKTILDAYAKTLPADMLVSSSADHAMMVVEAPTVQYLADGSIDLENSFVLIQDQRGGSSSTAFFEEQVAGRTVYYTGYTRHQCNFQYLYEKNYIPVTTAEFMGTKEYEKAVVSTKNVSCSTFEELCATTVTSNYPLAVINILATDADANEITVDKILFSGDATTGVPKSYDLSSNKKLNGLDKGLYTSISVEVVVSTGERFVPISITI